MTTTYRMTYTTGNQTDTYIDMLNNMISLQGGWATLNDDGTLKVQAVGSYAATMTKRILEMERGLALVSEEEADDGVSATRYLEKPMAD